MSQFYKTTHLITRIIRQTAIGPQFAECRSIKRWVAPTLKTLKQRKDKCEPEPPKPRSTYLEWNYDAEIFAFGKRLGENFDKTLLKQALTHKTYVNLQQDQARERNEPFTPLADNGQMIGEGESIIQQFLTNKFAKVYANSDVSQAICAYLSSEQMLAHVARHMGLTDIVKTPEFPVEDKTLADTFRAVVSALSQSSSLDQTYKFLDDFLVSQLNGKQVLDIWEPEKPYEYLTKLLGNEQIEPRLCNESASNTILANFQVGLYNQERKLLGMGWGESVHVAKNTAALNAIQRLYSF